MARAGQLGAVFLVSGAVGNLVDRFYVGGAPRRSGEFMCCSCVFNEMVVFQWPTKRLVFRSRPRYWHLKSVRPFVWIYLRALIYWGCRCAMIFKVIDYFLLQLKGIVNTSFFWNLSDLYIDFAVIFLSLETAPSWGVAPCGIFFAATVFQAPWSCNTSWNTTYMIIRPFGRAGLSRHWLTLKIDSDQSLISLWLGNLSWFTMLYDVYMYIYLYIYIFIYI